MSSPSPRTLLERLGLKPQKSLGQHFLTQPKQARRIVAALDLTPADVVVEVGPGLGALTRPLAEQAARLVALELDRRLAEFLKQEFQAHPQVLILCQDILTYDLTALAREAGRPLKVVGNLPYQITSPLLFKLAAEKAAIERAVLMMQQEVALRLMAAPGGKDYGILSVLLQYHFAIESLFTLGPGNFYPPPQVTSTVVRLRPRLVEPAAADPELLRRLVRLAFGQRRKTLANSLGAGAADLGLTPAQIAELLKAVGIEPQRRAETLSVAEFVALANRLTVEKVAVDQGEA